MTPKEKAEELIKKSTSLGNIYCAKRHCLWFCDEFLKENLKLNIKVIGIANDLDDGDLLFYVPTLDYYFWEEVKLEINKL